MTDLQPHIDGAVLSESGCAEFLSQLSSQGSGKAAARAMNVDFALVKATRNRNAVFRQAWIGHTAPLSVAEAEQFKEQPPSFLR